MAIKIYHTRAAPRYATRVLGSVTRHGLCAGMITESFPPHTAPARKVGWPLPTAETTAAPVPSPSGGWVASAALTLLRTLPFPTRAVCKVFGSRKGNIFLIF